MKEDQLVIGDRGTCESGTDVFLPDFFRAVGGP